MAMHEFRYRGMGTEEHPPNMSKVTLDETGNLQYDILPMNKTVRHDDTIEFTGDFKAENGEILHQCMFSSRYFHLVRNDHLVCLGGHSNRNERIVKEYLAGEMTSDDLYYYPPHGD